MGEHWAARNTLDEELKYIKDVYAFAEPLLKKALSDYGNIDVRNTFVRLYAPARNSWWVIEVNKGVTSRTVSLLDAALHNFSAGEAFADYAFLSKADARGQQNTLTFTSSTSGQPLTAHGFKSLCRSLDIGRQYQTRLLRTLGVGNQVQADTLRLKVIACDKAALKNAACIALSQQHIEADAQRLLFDIVEGKPAPALDGVPVEYYNLSLLDARLNGVLLIAAPQGSDKHIKRLIAYIPEDPEHPLKEYASPVAFMNELTRQLRDSTSPADATGQVPDKPTYRQFFSQFVDHKQRGHFFAELQNRLYKVRWHQKARTDSGPSWRNVAVDTPQ
ncbi:dermonecrotic toxin domain-containing protein [Pseudomonas fluorescens]